MGKDYSFVVVTKKVNKKAVEDYINLHSDEKYNLSEKNIGLVINFMLDSFILKYLEGGYSHLNHSFDDEIKPLLKENNKVKIGCIDYKEEVLDDSDDICNYVFIAVSGDMSRMFMESISVRKWFIELGKLCGALMVYIDMEDSNYRIFYFNSKEIDISIKGDNYFNLSVSEFRTAIEVFTKSAKGYFDYG